MKKILLATDFSDSCHNALKYALALIKKTDLKFDLVHVFDISVVVASNIPTRAFSDMLDSRTRAVEAHLEEIHLKIPTRHRGSTKAIYGPYTANEIAEYAKSKSYDLIIMALRQKYSLMDRIIGTVTSQTVHLSKIPILAIPNGSKFKGLNKILFPTAIQNFKQLTKTEEKAINWLSTFSKTFAVSKIHMVHIDPSSSTDVPDITHKQRPFSHIDFTVSAAVSVEEGIMKFSKKERADLLAFYKPHRYFWEQLYRSSLTRKMLFKSRTPLLLFS
ncbi:MAG: universal stress protein [Saprospiraceae bacterium]|nr:universal stress protein [Saprospiraceae bacterium]